MSKYNWHDGKGKVHSIPKATHAQNVAAKNALGSLDLTAPPTAQQAVREANSAADLQYGPQVQAAQQLQQNVAPWFANYQAMVAGYAQQAQQRMNPVLQQAQTYQQATGAQTAPGLDPNSAAGQQSAQAAAGRGALAQLGLDALNTNAQATQDYFGGQRAMAARVLPQQQAAADQNLANARSQRGAAVQGFLTSARQGAQNYAIARGTLGLNSEKAAADTDLARGVDPVTGKKMPGKPATTKSSGPFAGMTDAEITGLSGTDRQKKIDAYNKSKGTTSGGAKINKYGIPESQWEHWSTGHRQRVIDAFGEKGSGASEADKKKHAADVDAATGTVRNKITDVTEYNQDLIGQETDDTTKKQVKDEKTGKMGYPPRPVTQADVDKMKIAKYGVLARIAIAIRDGVNLTAEQIDYLHGLDKNFRVPRDWISRDHRRGVTHPLDKHGSGNNPPSRTGMGDIK